MGANQDIRAALAEQVSQAYGDKTALRINAGNSKTFYGNTVSGSELDVNQHCGIIDYHPSELVITARAGTRLDEIEKTLKENNQMLAFEPPRHSKNTTFGGSIATGLSGPRRAYSGSARDFVLGTQIINGKGEVLKFGGQVMKNVAGYDASRLMVGAQGTLGILLDISVKVLPIPESELTIALDMNESDSHETLHRWIKQGHPITASCHYKNTLYVRLSSTQNSVNQALKDIGGESCDSDLWVNLRNQTHEFFNQDSLWRLSLPTACDPIKTDDTQLIEWSGAQRWVISAEDLYDTASQNRGHATRYIINGEPIRDCFQPLAQSILALHKRLKHSFDPAGILNPGRTYTEL